MNRTLTAIYPLIAFCASAAFAGLPEGKDAFEKRQYTEARKELASFAEQGDAEAMSMMGDMFLRGLGGNRDELKARDYITAASDKGSPRANFVLGTLYNAGNLVTKDEVKGLALIRQAAEKGYPQAQSLLGTYIANGSNGFSKDEAIALTWFKAAVEQKDSSAMNWLGAFYEKGLGGLTSDNLIALDWYRKSAEALNSDAMVSVGRMYAMGQGISADGSEALKWLRRASALGNQRSYIWIGSVYEFGRGGINKNPILAYAWYAAVSLTLSPSNAKIASDGKDRIGKAISSTDLQEAEKQSKTVVLQNLVNTLPSLVQNSTPSDRKGAYGSGVVVSTAGDIVTNEHVVQGCNKLRAQPSGIELKLVAKDGKNDLALLRASGAGLPHVKVRSGKGLRLGDEIVALGYPLRGMLSTGPVVTSGIVNAMSGFNNDTSGFQMSATVQPGSSGGPVFDRQGALVGIVRARLLTTTPVNAQNINFAINLGTLTGFLDAHSVDYQAAATDAQSVSVGDIVSKTNPATIQVECY